MGSASGYQLTWIWYYLSDLHSFVVFALGNLYYKEFLCTLHFRFLVSFMYCRYLIAIKSYLCVKFHSLVSFSLFQTSFCNLSLKKMTTLHITNAISSLLWCFHFNCLATLSLYIRVFNIKCVTNMPLIRFSGFY